MPDQPIVALIADDLTGTLDAIVPFAQSGRRCIVATAPEHLSAALRYGADVIGVSTNTREGSGAQAAAFAAQAATALQGAATLIKKIDSRLKGHIGSEVAAVARALGVRQVLICPAIPQMGRVVSGGMLRGHGVDVPLLVADCLAGQGLDILAPDAASDADIDAILAALPPKCLLVGASGLTAGVARRGAQAGGRAFPLPLSGPVVFVIGSRDPITLAQVAKLRQTRPAIPYLAAPNGRITLPPLRQGAIIQATPGPDAVAPDAVARELASGLVAGLDPSAHLVLTGGETAAAVLAGLGAGVLEVVGEALPGVPVCRPAGRADAPLILTKSGGFGDPDTLSRLVGAPLTEDLT